MVLQIASLNLTGATVGQTGSVSWARTDRPATLTQIQRGQHPWLELVNMSACFIAVVVGVGSDSIPLPPGSWHVYPLSRDDTSYNFTVLTNNQNATNNTVFGWYYSADEPSPTTGQIVNQSTAIAAPAQLASQFSQTAATPNVITIGPSTTASSFLIQSVTVGFSPGHIGLTIGVGTNMQLRINGNGGTAIWLTFIQEQDQPYFFPVNLAIPNVVPGTTTAQIKADAFPAQFSVTQVLSVIASLV